MIRWKFKSLLIACCCCMFLFRPFAYGKAVVYDSKDGLSENQITAICKDGRGLMWVGTRNGLNLFDGYSFSKIQGNLNSSEITALLYDSSRQSIWVGTTQGLFRVNARTFQSTRVKNPAATETDENDYIAGLYLKKELHATVLFLVLKSGFIASVEQKGTMKIRERLPSTPVNACFIAADAQGSLLVLDNRFAFRFNTQNGKIVEETGFNNKINFINSIGQYDANTLLVSTFNSGMFLYDLATRKESIPPFLKQVNDNKKTIYYAERNKGYLYFASGNYGFFRINIATGRIDNISGKEAETFDGKQFNCLFVDEQGILWIGTNKGIIKFEGEKQLFENILLDSNRKISTRNIIEDRNGDLYVASYNGLYLFSKKEQKWSLCRGNPVGTGHQKRIYQNDVLPYSLLNDTASGYIYIGMESSILLRFNKINKTFEYGFYKEESGPPLRNIYAFAKAPNDEIWIGCGNGLAVFDPFTSKLYHKNNLLDGKEYSVHSLVISRDKKNIYAGTTNGLFIINLADGREEHYNIKTTPALSNDDIFCIWEDGPGKLWLGTNGGGVNILSRSRQHTTFIKKENGLSNGIVYGILPGAGQHLWISTFDGLNCYNSQNNTFINYYKEQGLSSDEFNKNSFLKGRDGKLYFGGINGINAFYPERLTHMSHPKFNILLSAITKWDNKAKAITTVPYIQEKNAVLNGKPSDPLMELHFACSDYTDPPRDKYLYRIQGLYNNWVSLGNRHSFNISGIPYGKYILEVKAMNARGIYSANTLKIRLHIIQPFYKKWWFYLLLFVAGAALIYGIYLFKLSRLKSLINLRVRIASNLHDEVGSLLTSITMFADNLSYQDNNADERQSKLKKIAKLSREATSSMSDVLWAIDGRNDFAGNLADRMKEHAETMLGPLGIDLIFKLTATDPRQPLASGLRRDVYLIFKEAINNIAKHAQQTRNVEVVFRLKGNHLYLQLSNDVVSKMPVDGASGQGLKNMKMRAGKIGAEIKMLFQDGKFIIRLTK